jgi:EpsD family peptidyl-prolyl cis-trans isomerase
MASKALIVVVAAGVAVSTAGCDKIQRRLGGQPKGQVVATVNGEEITTLELRNELNGFNSPDPKVMKQAQDQALQQVLIRDLLAQKAKAEKLDKVPLYSLQVRRGEKTLLSQMYESKLFGNVAPPTRKEAENYIANNPDKFAKRRVFIIDRVVAPASQVAKEKIPSIMSLEQLKALLDAQSTPYQETVVTMDTLSTPPDTIKGMDALPAGEVFVFQQGNALVFNHIFQTREAPFRGELAISYATDQLRKTQAEDFVRTQILGMRRAAEPGITYAKGYKPDNPDMGIAPVQGAPGAPAEAKSPGEAAGAEPAPGANAASPPKK